MQQFDCLLTTNTKEISYKNLCVHYTHFKWDTIYIVYAFAHVIFTITITLQVIYSSNLKNWVNEWHESLLTKYKKWSMVP